METVTYNGVKYAPIGLPKVGEKVLVKKPDGSYLEVVVDFSSPSGIISEDIAWGTGRVLRRVEPQPEQPHTTYASAPNITETKAPVLEGPADMSSRQNVLENRMEAIEVSMGDFARFVRRELVKAGLLKPPGSLMLPPGVGTSKTPPPKQDLHDERMREVFNGELRKTVGMYLGENAPEPLGWNAFMIFGYKLWICVSDIERRLNEARSKAYQEPFTTESE